MTTEATSPLLEAVALVAPVVQQYADESERIGRLAEPVVTVMKQARLFKGLAPRELGGFEVDPLTWYQVVEAAARVDGSFGWCLFINGSSGLFGENLSEADAERLLTDPETVFAGAVFPFGKAVATDGGYKASGRWGYASGSPFASHIFGFAIVHDGDTPRMRARGPVTAWMIAPRESVQLLDTWQVSGLSGTGSNDFIMDDLFVPESMAPSLVRRGSNRYYTAPLYRMPFLSTFTQPMGAVALGIAQHAIDAVVELAQQKVPVGVTAAPLRERPLFHLQLSEAQAAVESARAWLHQQVTIQYELVLAGKEVDLQQRNMAQLAASNATRSAAKAVEVMYLAAGGTANFRSSPLQRCMRDMHAVTQHAATSPATWEACGSVAAGMPPANPMMLL